MRKRGEMRRKTDPGRWRRAAALLLMIAMMPPGGWAPSRCRWIWSGSAAEGEIRTERERL